MIDVNVSISGILMYCDESVCALQLGNGYKIEKCNLDSLFFKNRITNGRGYLGTDYFGTQIKEGNETYFICVTKDEVMQIESPWIHEFSRFETDEKELCKTRIEKYTEKEIDYLYEQIDLLRIFRPGNIGLKDVFFQYSFTVLDHVTNTIEHRSHNQARNTVAGGYFKLDKAEIVLCNRWMHNFSRTPYILMKSCIDEFSWGLEQIDCINGFKQYIKTLKMILLRDEHIGENLLLARRISLLLGNTESGVQLIYQNTMDILEYYAQSLSESKGATVLKNISENYSKNVLESVLKNELHKLENITREVVKNCLIRCKAEHAMNRSITWNEIKERIINELA